MNRKSGIVLIAALVMGGGFAGYVSYGFYQGAQRTRQAERTSAARQAQWDQFRQTLWQEIRGFDGSAGIVVQDLQTGRALGHQVGKLFPAASVIKVPIMAACFRAAEEGRLSLSDVVRLRGADKVYGSGELKAMPNGTPLKVDWLIAQMITHSDNTAANILIDRLGFEYLNKEFQEMGLANTRLSRKMMDFGERARGVENYTTAEDMAHILYRIYHRQLIDPDISERCLELLQRQMLKDRIAAKLPPGTLVANKTGLEKGVCHDAGIVFTPRGDFIVCALTQRTAPGNSQPAKKFIARVALAAYQHQLEEP